VLDLRDGRAGGAGVEIDVARVPQRETGMTPYEIMLSESQERMLLVVKKGREAEVERIFDKWDLHAVRIGEVTADNRMRVKDHGAVVAEIPNRALTDEAPVYRRPTAEPEYLAAARALNLAELGPPGAPRDVFARLLASPTIASKRWVYRQYDHMVRTNTLVLPGMGAGVVRVKGTSRALALSVDCNGRFVYLDPYRGAQLAVAEASRNVACAGGQPIGATNCLNFANPQRPRSCGSSLAPSKAWATRAARSGSRSLAGTSVCITRQMARVCCQHLCLAWLASLKTRTASCDARFVPPATW
jgi:phosphoribosylformylglycinamidine synthase